jgi:type IV pilus assembly protein PilM
METEELAESIIWEAKHNIPYPYEETNVDYAILRPSKESDDRNLDILLVAAKKDKIANYSNVISQIRKNLVAIEVDVFALQNAYEINYPELFREKTVAIINLGANITNIIIIEKGIPQLFRDLAIGGALFAENISKELNCHFDDAEKMLKGIQVDNIPEEQFNFILNMNVQTLLEEIEKTLSFYEAGEKDGKKVELVYLSGGLSKLKDLNTLIEQKIQVKTETFNPFRRIEFKDKKLDNVYYEDMAAFFGVATGLAIRQQEK